MNCEAMDMLFSNWKFAENHKAKIRSWIADIVEGNPITELHNKGFSLSSVNGFVEYNIFEMIIQVAGGFRNCVVPLMRMRPDVNVVYTENQVKADTFSIRMQAFAA